MDKKDKVLIGIAAGLGAAGAIALVRGRRSRYDFQNKVVVIVGGSRGLGLVMAREFAAEGANLALFARDEDELQRARHELERFGTRIHTVVCDARERSEIRDAIADAQATLGPIDVLVNNAGIIRVGPLELQTREDFEEAMQLHFWGPYHAIEAVLPEMKSRLTGRIVNISSIGGKIAVPHLASYSASKFALVGLSSAMRTELMKHGIYVTTVCPGLMRTGSHVNAEFKGQNEKEYALFSVLDALPLSSVSAESAARQIVSATRHGDAELTISVQAKLAAKFNALFPNTTAGLLELVDRFLPGPGGANTTSFTGMESRSDITPSWATANIDEAAEQNNELKPNEHIN